jgi:hypothetical protein
MRIRSEEEPEPPEIPDDPDDPEVEPETASGTGPTLIPAVSSSVDREYEYKIEVMTLERVLDGKSLPDLLTSASKDEWHLVEIIDAGDRKAILLRKRKEAKNDRRPVGFSLGR